MVACVWYMLKFIMLVWHVVSVTSLLLAEVFLPLGAVQWSQLVCRWPAYPLTKKMCWKKTIKQKKRIKSVFPELFTCRKPTQYPSFFLPGFQFSFKEPNSFWPIWVHNLAYREVIWDFPISERFYHFLLATKI